MVFLGGRIRIFLSLSRWLNPDPDNLHMDPQLFSELDIFTVYVFMYLYLKCSLFLEQDCVMGNLYYGRKG